MTFVGYTTKMAFAYGMRTPEKIIRARHVILLMNHHLKKKKYLHDSNRGKTMKTSNTEGHRRKLATQDRKSTTLRKKTAWK
ncbi:Hypothetical protein NTJ_13946 [Nesidiocoris tenuis]|uniref:Uncharacterized protein n=1 Tax=Nesidiocoris tenuis TaxID=355587 RepID=A0ABN7BBU4_9HEMI|nr:Hypothetical protein NTJ_13946 [Nesidiocoris tenuis]